MVSRFASIPELDLGFVYELYCQDPHPDKIDLQHGEQGVPYVLPVVREAETLLIHDANYNLEYLSVLGYEPFTKVATELLFGSTHPVVVDGRAFGVQCLSGTGSLRMGADFLARICNCTIVYVSNPSYDNHPNIFMRAGFEEIREYAYFDQQTRNLNISGMLSDLESAPEGAVVLLHGCAHNPTGLDPTIDQWCSIADVIKRKKLFPFFDMAYQGYASGDPDHDAWPLRYFANQGLELFCAQSFAKSFCIYSQRAGNVAVVVSDSNAIEPIKSQMALLARGNWSTPPARGAKIVHMVLTSPDMKKQWLVQLGKMSQRIRTIRKKLREKLEKLGTPGTWNHVTDQIGMFCLTGLNGKQVEYLMKNYHIYLTKNGRASLTGLNENNMDYFANAIHGAVTNVP